MVRYSMNRDGKLVSDPHGKWIEFSDAVSLSEAAYEEGKKHGNEIPFSLSDTMLKNIVN